MQHEEALYACEKVCRWRFCAVFQHRLRLTGWPTIAVVLHHLLNVLVICLLCAPAIPSQPCIEVISNLPTGRLLLPFDMIFMVSMQPFDWHV